MIPNNETSGFLSGPLKRLPLMILLLLVIMVAALATCVSHKAGQLEKERSTAMAAQDRGANVVVLILSPSKIKDRINLPGMTVPWVRLPVSAEVSGKISRKLAEEGSAVREGDALCSLDDRDYKNHFNATRAAFETANANHARVLELYGEQLAPRSLLDSAVAELEQSRSAMHMADLQLERCLIKAGMHGIINRMLVEPGQFVAVGDPVAEILQLTPIKVIVGIPESDIHAVRQVDTFEIRIDALGGKIFTGTKHHFSRSADPMAKLYDLEIRIDNPEGEILADMFARVDIVKRSSPLALTLPLYGIISTGGRHTVFVDAGGFAEKREVTLGIQEGWRIEITSGLTAGDRVVVVGQRDLVQGQKLHIIKEISDIKEL
jgi:membrane fusion protein, multidrug efflux system